MTLEIYVFQWDWTIYVLEIVSKYIHHVNGFNFETHLEGLMSSITKRLPESVRWSDTKWLFVGRQSLHVISTLVKTIFNPNVESRFCYSKCWPKTTPYGVFTFASQIQSWKFKCVLQLVTRWCNFQFHSNGQNNLCIGSAPLHGLIPRLQKQVTPITWLQSLK